MKNDAPRKAAPPVARADGVPNSQPSTLHSQPLSIPDHELIRCIGRGAYGEVWLARHGRLGTWHAVKIVRRDNFEDARPFQREFDGIRRYEPISRGHPNLVAILHVGGTDDCFFYVMELADDAVAADVKRLTSSAQVGTCESEKVGEGSRMSAGSPTPSPAQFREEKSEPPHVGCYEPRTLRSELKRHGALPIDRCLEIGLALAGALAHLHKRGLVPTRPGTGPRGGPLSPEERQQLEEWLTVQDQAEARLLSPKSGEPALAALRNQVEAALAQVGAVTGSIQQLSAQNDALREEIVGLRRRLAARPVSQPA